MKKVKALAMFSGGLDSILAIKLILNQGIEVEALNFGGSSVRARLGKALWNRRKGCGFRLRLLKLMSGISGCFGTPSTGTAET